MGRIAGVTAEETRRRVLDGAAGVFARKGYDGASIAEIASEAGVSSGAIYAHFPSKPQLFAATLHAKGPAELERLVAVGGSGEDIVQAFRERGAALAHRDAEEGSLVIEAIVAAKRHPDVAEVLISAFAEREAHLADLVRAGQQDGAIDRRLRPEPIARFAVTLVLGSLLVAAMNLPAVDEDDWGDLIGALVTRVTARQSTT